MSDPTRVMTAPPDHTADPPPNHETRSIGDATDRRVEGEVQTPDLMAAGYALKGEIGRGGMGIVYRAYDTSLNRDIAVKVLLDRFAPNSLAAVRFVEEARITGQLQHPGIPPIHEVDTLPDGRPFIAMKLIKGRTLYELLSNRVNLRGMLITAFEQLCQAVGYAHSRGVIHRDLKPHNVMIGAFGETQVMDWGLAKLRTDGRPTVSQSEGTSTFYDPREDSGEGSKTRAGAFLGTPAYMPPEQAIGAVDRVDERSDVFGLGGVLCAILTGEPPFLGADSESTRQLAAQGKVMPAFDRLDACGAEPELIALCKKCLAAESDERPQNGGEVAQAIAEFRGAAENRARKAELDQATAQLRVVEMRKRRQHASLFAAAVMLALAAGGIATFVKYQDEAAQRAIAEGEKQTADRERAAAQAETSAKEQALRQLTEQQTATEEALVRGILRPLRIADRDSGRRESRLSGDESRALAELSRLPERLQLRFVELALTTAGGPEKLKYRAGAIVHAIAGLDRERAMRIRAAIDRWFAAALGGTPGQFACVELAIALPHNASMDSRFAEFLADRMIEGSAKSDSNSLRELLGRMDRARAKAIAEPRARAIADMIESGEKTKSEISRLGVLWSHLEKWLEPDEAATMAGRAARSMLARMAKEPASMPRDESSSALKLMLEKVGKAEAAQVVRPFVRNALTRLTKDQDRPYLEQLSTFQEAATFVLHLDAAEIESTLQNLSGWITESIKASDPYRMMMASLVLTVLSDPLPPARRKAILVPHVTVMADRIAKEGKNTLTVTFMAMGLGQIVEKLPPGEYAALLAPPARVIAEQLVSSTDPTSAMLLPKSLESLLAHLDPVEAKTLAGKAAKHLFGRLLKATASEAGFLFIGDRHSLMSDRLEPEDVAEIASALTSRIAAENDPAMIEHLLKGLDAIKPRLDRRMTTAAAKALQARLAKDANPELAIPIAQGIANLSRYQQDGELLTHLKRFGSEEAISTLILAEFSRRAGRGGAALQTAVGAGAAVAAEPFDTVWEFVDWGEKNRKDLDFRSSAEIAK